MLSFINHTSFPDEFLYRIVREAMGWYETIFQSPSCDVEVIVCRDTEELQDYIAKHLGDDSPQVHDYDGNFLCQYKPGEPYRILLTVKKEAFPGAQRYYDEVEKGSLKDRDIQDREQRGIELANFCHLLELVQHEYSHLCNFEKLMDADVDPDIGDYSLDYHLYDEEIARYRGIYSMLRMMEPYAEKNLLYTLWTGYWEQLLDEFKERSKIYDEHITHGYENIAKVGREYMLMDGITASQMAEEFETELGHPLKYGGQLSELGIPKMSREEVVEYYMDEEEDIPHHVFNSFVTLMYHVKNRYATYEGAQVIGLVHAFYDFLKGERREYNLQSLMEKPYYETVDVEKVRSELEELPSLFMKR